MDPRGLGLSDRLTEIPTLEDRVDDLLSVLDAAESEHATLFGTPIRGLRASPQRSLIPTGSVV
jgi:pimeloyl-ACP methyl ester carboxylesterase